MEAKDFRHVGMWTAFRPEVLFRDYLDGTGITHIIGGFCPAKSIRRNAPEGGRGLMWFSGEAGGEPYIPFKPEYPGAIEFSYQRSSIPGRTVWYPGFMSSLDELCSPKKVCREDFVRRANAIVFLCSNRYHWRGRGKPLVDWRIVFSKRLAASGMRVDSAGRFAPTMPKIPKADTFPFISGRRFMLCSENAETPGYFTEKAVNAWRGGAIPIYRGAPDAHEYLNPDAAIILDAGSDAGEVAKRLAAMDESEWVHRASQPLFQPWVRSLGREVRELTLKMI